MLSLPSADGLIRLPEMIVVSKSDTTEVAHKPAELGTFGIVQFFQY